MQVGVGGAEPAAARLQQLDSETPSCSGPLQSGVQGMPAAALASRISRSIGRGERGSVTRSGPSAPCHSEAPRELDSARMNAGNTSSHPQPGAPCASQPA